MPRKRKRITVSMEDYIEAIYLLCLKNGHTRVKDIAKKLKVKASSVSEILDKLKERELIEHEKYGLITLTEKGRKVAEEIYHKHQVLLSFLVEVLGVDPKVAEKDACAMEHSISPQTLEKLVAFVEKLKRSEK